MKVDVMNQQSFMMAARRAAKDDRTHGTSVTASRSRARRARRGGFTLVELLVVITIIGIILAFIISAGMDAARRAEERATQSLITKLEAGLSDRLEALLQIRPEPNFTHAYMAAIWNPNAVVANINPLGTIPPPTQIKQTERAQVIAWYDYIKSEMPDVFFVQSTAPGNTGYPLNFAAVPIIGTDNSGLLGASAAFVLPLGNTLVNNPNTSFGDGNFSSPSLGFAGSGIFGAAYEVAAGLYKNLGYLPTGYDGVDNSPAGSAGAGLIDEWGEGVNSTNENLVTTNLQNHQHVTARAETLYAVLVAGTGPLGSVFSPDDFTTNEVRDTDGDGMPEFVDAWGQPLQFFRWPLFYHSDLQRGQNIVADATTSGKWDLLPPYFDPVSTNNAILQQREQNPLDLNQQLMAPGWWSHVGSGGIAANSNAPNIVTSTIPIPTNASAGVHAFQALFHTLCEPLPTPGGAQFWDRGTTYGNRRAFYSKFLILSGGPDMVPGVFLYANSDMQTLGTNAAQFLIANENNAMPFGLDMFGSGTSAGFETTLSLPGTSILNAPSVDPTHPSSSDIIQGAGDDISNHSLLAGGVIGGSG
jgi:prepilin-type N-terminal cleavage/methylation domain-containing protein